MLNLKAMTWAAALSVTMAFVACGDEQRMSSGTSVSTSQTAPGVTQDCPQPPDLPLVLVETLSDFVTASSLVVDVTVEAVRQQVDVDAPDMRFEKVLLDVSVNAVLKGDANEGDKLIVYASSVTSDPQSEGDEPVWSEDLVRFERGHRLIAGLGELDDDGERDLITTDAYFLVTDGRLDPQLSEARTRCAAGEPKAIFQEVDDLSVDQLQDRISNLAE